MRKIIIIVMIVLLVAIAAVLGIRIASGEDNWICRDGNWIKHGNPSSPKPVMECKK